MRNIGSTIYLSASDLSKHIYCKHATFLDLQLAKNMIKAPRVFENPSLEALQQKGLEFEKGYIQQLKDEGKKVVEISGGDTSKAAQETATAMKWGADIIYQARLELGIWNGWADFLIRVEKPGKFAWSYEVMDTKLSKETKTGAILQISLYSEMLEQLQGVKPEYMHIKNPSGEHRYRVDDFAAYYRLIKNNLLQSIGAPQQPIPRLCRIAMCADGGNCAMTEDATTTI